MQTLRSSLKEPSRTIWTPDLDAQLNPVIDRLISASDLVRRDALAAVLENTPRVVWLRIIDRLLDLTNCSSSEARRNAEKSLEDMGEIASPTLRSSLLKAKNGAFKAKITELLGRIAVNCSPTEQDKIKLAINISLGKADFEDVVGAVWQSMGFSSGDAEMLLDVRKMAASVRRKGSLPD